MRFLPDIRYGTENYPEGVARRLRLLNSMTWGSAAVAIGGAVVDLAVLKSWKAVAVCAISASIWASIPLLHRFGTLCGALTCILTAYAYFFALTCLFGTDSGLQMGYLLAAAFVFVVTERIFLSAVLGVLAVVLVVVLQIIVPDNTGLLDSTTLLASFVGTVIVIVAAAIMGATFALREVARAEADLAHEHAVAQDKSRQLEIADRYKSHFLASASHDLRQPLHALNLFVAQLQTETNPAERRRLVSRIDAAVASMNELFEALLDMTKLEAGILEANPAEFAVQRLLDRIETTFAELADKKGLNLHVVPIAERDAHCRG